jgi:hypothetical protein
MEGDAEVLEAGYCLQWLAPKAEACLLCQLQSRLLCACSAEHHELGLDGVDGQAPLLAVLLQQVQLALQPCC